MQANAGAGSRRRALMVAEKPSVAKELAAILSNGSCSSKTGESPYNRLFEYNGQLDGASVPTVMTSVAGHLMGLDFDKSYKKWEGCDPTSLLVEAPLVWSVQDSLVHVRRNLEKAVRGCTDLVLWLDCDREGEAIGFEVMHVCKSVQPRLRVRRARFSALIPRDIVHAVANLFEPDAKASDAVLARSECDLRLGAAFTRMQTLLLRDKFDGMPRMLSYGPCQFPTMWFVSQRAERISAFRPEDFWQIELSHRRTDEDGEEQLARFSWARYRLFDRLSCLVLYELCVARATAAVTSVAARPKSKMRPLPLATVELQMKASATLRISSDQTMKIAEELYQRGYLSYPRTETEKFKEGFDLHSMIRAQLADPRWGSYAQGLLDGGFVWPRPGSKDDNAHPPIHPVKCGADLSGDDAKLYEYVARRFLGCCSRDALGQETVVKVELAGELFTASGLMINERNYLDIFTYDRWTGRKIPYFYEGEHFEPHTLMMTSGTTTAPSPLTEAELIGLMERNGIGTDATIATHVKTILDREYVTKQQSSFHMTPVGSMLLKGYNDMPITNGKGVDIGKPELRAEMERTFDKVADGSMTKKEAIDHIIVGPAGMKYVFEAALKHQQVLLDTASALFSPVDTSRWARTRLGDGSSPACGTCDGPMGLFAESKPAAAGGGGGGGGGTNAFGDRSAPARSSLPRRALRCASCKVDHFVPPSGELTAHAHRCPLCRFQVLNVTNASTGNAHTVCPRCFTRAPAGTHESGAPGEMRCFQCTAACPLASGSTPVAPCPKCGTGSVIIKQRKGAVGGRGGAAQPGAFFSCSANSKGGGGGGGCSFTVWLPGGSQVTKLDSACAMCGGPTLKYAGHGWLLRLGEVDCVAR